MALSDLVVKIGSDAKGFNRGVSGVRKGIGSLAKYAAGAAAAVGAAYTVREAVGAAREQAAAEAKLAAVLEATGHAAGFSAKELKDQASALQNVSNFGDEAIISGQAVLATFKEIKGDQFEAATQAALDMSSVLGTNLEGSMIQLGKALNDPAKGISALSRAGVSFTDQQKEQIRVMQEAGDIAGAQQVILAELQGEFGGAAEAMVDPWTQMSNALGDILEPLGQVISDTLSWAMSNLALLDTISMVIDWIKLMIDYGKFLGENWVLVFDMIGSSFVASILLMVDRAKWFFTDVIPSFLGWFFNNWQEVFIDVGNVTITIFKNVAESIKNLMGEVWAFIKSGGTDAIQFNAKNLLDGFKSSIQEAYELPEFQAGQMTQGWVDRAAAGAEELDRRWAENRLAKQAEEMKKAGKAIDGTKPTVPGTDKASSKAAEDKFSGAMEEGSLEAYRSINSTRNPQYKEQVKTNQILTQMNNKLMPATSGQTLEAF